MALGSLVYAVEVELSDVDRGVYETLALKVAQHPSESETYLVARILAYVLEFSPDIAFSRGLSHSEEPAVWAHDPTGQLLSWIEVGTPDAARLHKARKAADDVAVYCHKDFAGWCQSVRGQRVHKSETIRLYALDRALVKALAERLERRCTWSLTRSDGELYMTVGEDAFSAALPRSPWPG